MKKQKLHIFLFICFEMLLYFTFLYLDISTESFSKINPILKYISIMLCFLFSAISNFLSNRLSLLTLALAFAATADIFLLFTNYYSVGILFFVLVQICYYKTLSNSKQLIGTFMFCVTIVASTTYLMLIMSIKPDITSMIAVFYFSLLFINVGKAVIKAIIRKHHWNISFATGILLLFMCDLNVGLHNFQSYISHAEHPLLFQFIEFSHIGMWLFYLPSQVIVTLLSLSNEYAFFDKSDTGKDFQAP